MKQEESEGQTCRPNDPVGEEVRLLDFRPARAFLEKLPRSERDPRLTAAPGFVTLRSASPDCVVSVHFLFGGTSSKRI